MFKRKSNRTGNIIIVVLFTILVVLGFGVYNSRETTESAFVTKEALVIKDKTKTDIELWNQKVTKLQTAAEEASSLIVLKGVTNIDAVFDDTESDKSSNSLSWVKNKLSQLKSKQLTISSKYNFSYSYDLSNIVINNLGEGKLQIDLYQHKLVLEKVAEDTSATVLDGKAGIFAQSFEPQQIAEIMDRVKLYATNNIMTNEDIRLRAIKSAEVDLIDFVGKLGFEDSNVEIVIMPDYLLDDTVVAASNIVYN